MVNTIDADGIFSRVEQTKYMYENIDKFPTALEKFLFPFSLFDRNGKVVIANRRFRNLTGITEDDINKSSANIFDYLNESIAEAVKKSFDEDEDVIMQNRALPLRPHTTAAESALEQLQSAILFPMTYKDSEVQYVGYLLMFEKTADDG